MFKDIDLDKLCYWTSIEYKWKRIDPRNLFIDEKNKKVKIEWYDKKWNKISETLDF